MPVDAVATVSVYPSTEPSDFPADTEIITIRNEDFSAGGTHISRFRLRNNHGSVLHVRLMADAKFLNVVPLETALGQGEQQIVIVRTDTNAARIAVAHGAPPGAAIEVFYQRLSADGSLESSVAAPLRASIHIHLPFATCPTCQRSLDSAIAAGSLNAVPDVCPYCYERLRPCPICGTPNTWLARACVLDSGHVVRSSPDWGMLGGSAAHAGTDSQRRPVAAGLSRRWSFPSVAPARRENMLTWSAPAAAFGMAAAAAATADGDAFIYAFDIRNGAPLWDPFPLSDPVYPDRGGIAMSAIKDQSGEPESFGRLFAGSVTGTCVCLDALRGTRLWETRLGGRIYGAVVACADSSVLLVPNVADDGLSGALVVLSAETGQVLRRIPLAGPSDCTPAYADGIAYTHDDSGVLTAIQVETGKIVWSADCGGGFDSAPVLRDGLIFSATVTGTALCHDAETGREVWQLAITNSPLSGSPACDGNLLYLPADDGVHVVAAASGRAVRRYGTRVPVRSSPVISDGTLYFGATDGAVYAAPAGRSLERLYETSTVGSQIVAAPALADDTLLVAATNGVLYALGFDVTRPEAANGR